MNNYFNKKLLICIGPSESGKTTFAKEILKDYHFFDFDMNYWNDKKNFKNKFFSTINSHDKIVCDGWIPNPEFVDYVKGINYKFLIFIRNVNKIKKLLLDKQKKNLSFKQIEQIFFNCMDLIRKDYNNQALVVFNLEEEYVIRNIDIITEEDIRKMSKKINYEEVDKFITSLGHIYHNIKIGDKVYVQDKYCDYTYKQLSENFDFKDLTVADLGCYYGYFSFMAEDLGAKSVKGYDMGVIAERVKKIAEFKYSDVDFFNADIDNMDFPEEDVYMALNVLHHTDDPVKILNNMFDNSRKAVILELNLATNDEELHLTAPVQRAQKGVGPLKQIGEKLIDRLCEEKGFIKEVYDSARPGRKIFICERNVTE